VISTSRNISSQQWYGNASTISSDPGSLTESIQFVSQPVYVVDHQGRPAVTNSCDVVCIRDISLKLKSSLPLLGYAPPLHPAQLGDDGFKKDLHLQYAYIVGAMANGITSAEMVKAAGQAGMVGFFGAGGLSLKQVEAAISKLKPFEKEFTFGFNLIHSPNDPELESAVVELYLRHGIRLVSASAYMGLTLPLVYYRAKGIFQAPDGRIVCPNHVIAKVSRVEVARKFMAPPPQKILYQLVQLGKISEQEAQLASHIPVAQDVTAEADSGGHTDNRPALTLLPTFLSLRNESADQFHYQVPLRIGLAGGIATPAAAAAAFSMGAAYVLTGSINQACIEADTSQAVRELLIQVQQADVTMAPAADMFELGAKVQVLKRGTMFAMRAARLYELYRAYDCYGDIPESVRASIERDLLRSSFDQAWDQTRRFFEARDSAQIERAQSSPKHKMALVFRSYLGLSSQWAKSGNMDRLIDYQIWCGPSMGAFNGWVKGSFLESADQRKTALLAINLLYGAAVKIRCNWLQYQGICVPPAASGVRPLPMDEIEKRLAG
jgi:PfaD family protein